MNQIPKMGIPQKINPEKVACFSSPNPDRQLPSLHQQSTTTSPPKNYVLPPRFCQNPQQKQSPTTAKKIPQRHPSSGGVLATSGEVPLSPDKNLAGAKIIGRNGMLLFIYLRVILWIGRILRCPTKSPMARSDQGV